MEQHSVKETDDSFEPSKLGTKQYWDEAYQVELNNFDEFGDEGEIWFGKQCEKRIIEWCHSNFDRESCRILDIGSGNGHLLLSLAKKGFRNLFGLDYAENAVKLGHALFSQKEELSVAGFATVDFLNLDSNDSWLQSMANSFDLLLDKGTFDAISLMPSDKVDPSDRQSHLEHVRNLATLFKASLLRLWRCNSSSFVITSCNWTRPELEGFFGPDLVVEHQIEHPKFSFGGASGQVVTTLRSRCGELDRRQGPGRWRMLSVINLADSQETEHQSQFTPTNAHHSKLHDQAPSSDPVMMEIDVMDDEEMAVEDLAENPESALESELADIQGQEPTKEVVKIGSAQFTSWLKTSALRSSYLYSHGGIKFRSKLGLRGHPVTVSLLSAFFSWFSQQTATEARTVILDSSAFPIIPLVSCLLEESILAEPVSEIIEVLLPHSVSGWSDLSLVIKLGDRLCTLLDLIPIIGEICFYGPFDAQNTKHKSSCFVWQVRDERMFPAGLAEVVKSRRQVRIANKDQLDTEYKALLGIDEVEPIQVQVQVQVQATPRKSKGKPSKEKEAPPSVKSNQKQLSSFFTVFKKAPPVEVSSEYFQPFYLKEDSTLAPINHFSDYHMMAEEDTQQPMGVDFWADFRHRCKKSAVAWQGKQLAFCPGWGQGSITFPVKLLQFHENFRPAYYGSLRNLKLTKSPSGRNPWAMDPKLDYEVDSDDDWCEEEEINDGESILSEDDDEEDEDDEDEADASSEMEGDEWLVEEGACRMDEEEDADVTVPTFKRQSYKKGQKRRYVHLQPLLFGPYNQCTMSVVPDVIKNIRAQCLFGNSVPIDPFAGTILPDRPKEATNTASIPKVAFQESHLPDLAALANGSHLGFSKLYDIFALKHGRVSKKQFELRLNQIAEKTPVQPGKRPQWIVRPEYTKLLVVQDADDADGSRDAIDSVSGPEETSTAIDTDSPVLAGEDDLMACMMHN